MARLDIGLLKMNEADMNERYKITDVKNGIIQKLDMNNKPDTSGIQYHIINELPNGYMVYVASLDQSQPSPSYFLDKRFFANRNAPIGL